MAIYGFSKIESAFPEFMAFLAKQQVGETFTVKARGHYHTVDGEPIPEKKCTITFQLYLFFAFGEGQIAVRNSCLYADGWSTIRVFKDLDEGYARLLLHHIRRTALRLFDQDTNFVLEF